LSGLVNYELFPVEVLSMNTSRLKLLGFFGAIILLSPTLSYSAQTNSTCDPSRIRIEQATSLEQKSACVAIRQLEDFFLKMAAPVTLDVTLKFENEVFLPLASTAGKRRGSTAILIVTSLR
jgi:hypothetical protein